MSTLNAQQELQQKLNEAAELMQEAGAFAGKVANKGKLTDEDCQAVRAKWNEAFDAYKKLEILAPALKVQ